MSFSASYKRLLCAGVKHGPECECTYIETKDLLNSIIPLSFEGVSIVARWSF